MKKVKEPMRPEYKRSDFSTLERGKFHDEAGAETTFVLLKPEIAKAFPTSDAVNDALAGLLELTRKTAKITRHSNRARASSRRQVKPKG